MMNSMLAISIVLAALGTLLAGSACGVKLGWFSGESGRKLVHVGMGGLCMFFPILFKDPSPVQLLAVLAVVAMLGIRLTRLKDSLGSSLFSVSRLSIGELIFPIAVAWLFTLNSISDNPSPLFYTIPLLLLTLADTAGAIAGTRFGKRIYLTASGQKSVEGSVAFFLTAYACSFIPLVMYSDYACSHIAFVALTVALFITAVEGISGMGMDNLLIPIGSYFLLDYYSNLSTELLWIRALSLVLLTLLLVFTRRLHALNGGAVLSAVLLCFISFVLGGWVCLTASLLIFVRHILALKKIPTHAQHTHSIDAVFAVSTPALIWLTLGRGNVLGSGGSSLAIGQSLFICSLAVTIAMLHIGTRKVISNNSLSIQSILKACGLAVVVSSLTYFIIPRPVFYLVIISTIVLSISCSSAFYYLRSQKVSSLNDWIKLSTLNLLAMFILYSFYSCYANYHTQL